MLVLREFLKLFLCEVNLVTLVKFGGSLITNKQVESSFREDVVRNLAIEVRQALDINPDLELILAHGSGSFGHFAANRFGTVSGVSSHEGWLGFAEVGSAAAELNHLVFSVFREVGVPLFHVQPSASAIAVDGKLFSMSVDSVRMSVENGLIPLLYGDVAFDSVRGGTIISTEAIFFYLVDYFSVDRILLVGDARGVYGEGGSVIPVIMPSSLDAIVRYLGGSSGVDVTGGMLSKVRDMLDIVSRYSEMTIRIFDFEKQGVLRDTLLNRSEPGTLICAD